MREYVPMFPSIDIRLILFSMESFIESFIESSSESGHGLLVMKGIFPVNKYVLLGQQGGGGCSSCSSSFKVWRQQMSGCLWRFHADVAPPRKWQLPLLARAPRSRRGHVTVRVSMLWTWSVSPRWSKRGIAYFKQKTKETDVKIQDVKTYCCCSLREAFK